MALVTITPIQIEIDIADLVIGSVTLKRKATLFTMIYNQSMHSLTLSWIVSYTDIAGVKGISNYSKELIADNSTMVDAATGAIITPVVTTDPDTQEQTIFYGDRDYVGQYDWFNRVAETQQINVHDMIRQYGEQANWD